jgi:hypothetical protein
MSVDRIKGEVVFICDECDDTLETGEDDFTEARATLQHEGWSTQKSGPDWLHYCVGCGDSRGAAFKDLGE